MFYTSMLVVILGTVLYHVSQKLINPNVIPMASMSVTYAIALLFSLVSLFIFGKESAITSFKELNWASYTLGIVIFTLEIGFLFVYRSGWNINTAALFANIISAVILTFIGITIFKESISIKNIIGIVLSVIGMILMRK
ncbi:hypothetical protein [Alkalithermobacter paradoxus]|uniref:EamA-like transporter family protein n=1 Tax=Alkalithermobacter paradoxus TaxID=29349 RepID=A0A1V4I5Z4_9FIRM|nr:hypothetical protein CLOTH_14600 [[Clostridium] thermoalcaliphilum]